MDKTTLSLIIDTDVILTIPSGATAYLDDTWNASDNKTVFGTITVNGGIQNNGTLYISDADNDKVTTDSNANTVVGGGIIIDGTTYVQGGDITASGFNFETNAPTENTYYTAGEGYLLYNVTDKTITLHSTTFENDSRNIPFYTGNMETVLLEGTNTLRTSGGRLVSVGNLTVEGKGDSPVLSMSGSDNEGVDSYGELTIKNCTVNLADKCNVSSAKGVTIENSTVQVTGTESTYPSTGTIPNVKAGSAAYSWAVTFTSTPEGGVSKYTDVAVESGSVTITPFALNEDMVNVGPGCVYISEAIEPVTVKNGTTTLTKDTDYTVEYSDNVKAGTAKAIVEGIGNYSGEIEKTFTIQSQPLIIKGVNVSSKEYDGTTDTQDVEIIWNGKLEDDTITYAGSVDWSHSTAGTNTITYSLALTGDSSTNYTLTGGRVYDDPPYNGATITQRTITVTANDQEVTYGTDIATGTQNMTYTTEKLLDGHSITAVTLTQNTFNVTPVAGEALTITPSDVIVKKGNNDVTANYAITCVPGDLTINAKNLADSMIADIANQTYTGSEIEPTITVTDGDPSIIITDDYTIGYSANTNVGDATVTITAKADGNYTGTASKDFTIAPKALTISSVSVDTKEYDGTTATTGGTINLTGAVDGETPVATGTFTWTDIAVDTATVNVASIALTDDAVNDNYSLVTTSLDNEDVTTAITTRAITITANAQPVTYGTDIDKTTDDVADTNSKLLDGHNITAVTLTASSDQVATTGKTITPSGVTIKKGDTDMISNYNITYTDGDLAITAKPITITTQPQTVTYGTAIATTVDDVTVESLITGESLDSIVLTESDKNVATENKTVKAATPVIKNGDIVIANSNYDITFTETGVLTIDPLEVVLAWTGENGSTSDFSFSYDGSDKTVTATVTNPAYEETLAFPYTESVVGSYTATITDLENDNYKLPTDSSVSRTWDITKAPITITVTNNTALTGSGDIATVTTEPAVDVIIAHYDRTGALVDDITIAPAGTYSMVATMDSGDSTNYYFSGSVGDTIKLGNFVIATTEPTAYTVTFDEAVDSALPPAISGTIHILPTSTHDSHVDETFIGWNYNDVIYPAGSAFTQPGKHVEMTATWETPSTITGTVTDSASAIVPGATVTISQMV